jgi:hypothetical protein
MLAHLVETEAPALQLCVASFRTYDVEVILTVTGRDVVEDRRARIISGADERVKREGRRAVAL